MEIRIMLELAVFVEQMRFAIPAVAALQDYRYRTIPPLFIAFLL